MTVRYSDDKLEFFKSIIEKKLTEALLQLENLQEQILEISENTDDEFGTDWMDDSSTSGNLEMLNNMAIRQRKFIRDLENALVRIKNKTYGICTTTGELIPEERLKAVPTTTKSILAKDMPENQPERVRPVYDEEEIPKPKKKEDEPRKIITKVIKPAASSAAAGKSKSKVNFEEDDLDTFEDLGFDDEEFESEDISNHDFPDTEEIDDI
jgi:RNA polymerase-binding protein DksA